MKHRIGLNSKSEKIGLNKNYSNWIKIKLSVR